MIESALVQNKQNVIQFFNNSSLLNKLRNEANNLTLELTYEIQKEIKQLQNQTYQDTVG